MYIRIHIWYIVNIIQYIVYIVQHLGLKGDMLASRYKYYSHAWTVWACDKGQPRCPMQLKELYGPGSEPFTRSLVFLSLTAENPHHRASSSSTTYTATGLFQSYYAFAV